MSAKSNNSQTKTASRDLAIPIYLNQRVVFDLLAIVQEGFTQLRTIKTSEAASQSSSQDLGGQVGISNVFAFLGVGFKRSKGKEQASQSQNEMTEERVFTPTSLFSTLRDTLIERKLLANLDTAEGFNDISSGSFVEFTAILQKNPMVDTLEGMIQLLETAMLFQSNSQPKTSGGGSKRPAGQGKPTQRNQEQTFIRQLEGFLKAVTQANTLDLVANLSDGKRRAVVPVEVEFFSDRTPAAIIDGEFAVLGKVVRVIAGDKEAAKEGSIDLLRGTSLGRMQDGIMTQFRESISGLGDLGFNFPELHTKIEAPVIQVVPIAIFV